MKYQQAIFQMAFLQIQIFNSFLHDASRPLLSSVGNGSLELPQGTAVCKRKDKIPRTRELTSSCTYLYSPLLSIHPISHPLLKKGFQSTPENIRHWNSPSHCLTVSLCLTHTCLPTTPPPLYPEIPFWPAPSLNHLNCPLIQNGGDDFAWRWLPAEMLSHISELMPALTLSLILTDDSELDTLSYWGIEQQII